MNKIFRHFYQNQKLIVELDKNQVFPENPGMGTPEMVSLYQGREEVGTATLNCALNEGEIEGYILSQGQLNFLEKCMEEAEKFLYKN